jgi:hypothetical protein
VTEYRLLFEEMRVHIDKMKKLISGSQNFEPEDYHLEHTNVYGRLLMMKIVIYLDKQSKTLKNKSTELEEKMRYSSCSIT